MRGIGEWNGSDRRRGRLHFTLAWLFQNPSGECTRKWLRERNSDRSRRHSGSVAPARSGDGKSPLSRPGMQGTFARRYVPERRWNGSAERGQYDARYDLIQSLSENDGG